MARTRAGKALTSEHRVAQIAVGEVYRMLAVELAGMVDPADLTAAREALLVDGHALTLEGYEMSSALARTYVEDFRLAETGARSGPVITPPMGYQHVATSLNEALERGAALMASGIGTPEQIADTITVWVADSVRLGTMYGARNTVMASAYQDRGAEGRWRRVTDGQPCAFCAMLATRGPVYKQDTAGFRTHDHCGCTPEIVYGVWRPTELEMEWIRAYSDVADVASAAEGARVAPKPDSDEDTILWRMRRYRPDLFSDGVTPA